MKKIDKLIKKAVEMSRSVLITLFPPDDDSFISALGVEPERYERKNRDGTTGYDVMAALDDTAPEVWECLEAELQEEAFQETQQEDGLKNMLLGMWRNV